MADPESEGALAATTFSGYLSKKGGRRKNWKRRWFWLEAGQVKYWPKKVDVNAQVIPEPLGSFFVRNAECSLAESSRHPNLFRIATPGRVWWLRADSKDEIDQWKLRLERSGAQWSTDAAEERAGDKEDYDSED